MTDNSVKLAHDLTKLTISNSHRLITLDTKTLYVNIAILENIDIARAQLLKHNDKNTTEQICKLLKMALQQNYFAFQEQVYQPTKGVGMGSPISGITAQIFLRHLEQSHVRSLLDSKHITFYARYVDGILIIHDASRTNPDAIAQYSNSIHRNLQLNATLEANDPVNFLDLSYQSLGTAPNLKLTTFVNPQPPIPLSATYPTTQVNINLRHTDTTLTGCSISPSIMTDYTMSGKPSFTLQKTINSQLPYSTN